MLKAAKVASGEETNQFGPAVREEPPTKRYAKPRIDLIEMEVLGHFIPMHP